MVYEYFTNLDIEHIDVDTMDNAFSISEFPLRIEFSKSFIEKDILNYDSDLLYDKKLNEDHNQIIYQDYLSSFSLIFDDSYILDYIEVGVLSLAKNKTFKPLFELQLEFLTKKIIDTKINIDRLQRGLEFSVRYTNTFDSNMLSSIEFSNILYQLLDYQSIFDLLSSSSLEPIPTITIPIAITTLSFAKTKLFSPSISFDNYLSSVEDLTSSPHFQSNIESLLTSVISFDDAYSTWKVIILAFSKNLNFDYNQIQDFEIGLNITQVLSDILTITPSVEAVRVALKEILAFARQIEVLAISNQIRITTIVK